MKKLLVGIFAVLGLSLGIACGSQEHLCVRAEDEIVESSGGEVDVVGEAVSGINEFKENVEAICSQPIVIAGVSTTLGALIIFVISKLIDGGAAKKLKAEIEKLKEKSNDKTKDEQILCLTKELNELVNISKLLVDGCKNVNIKEKAKKLLEEVEPIKTDSIKFAKEEHEKIVADTKEFLAKEKDEIAEILNKE